MLWCQVKNIFYFVNKKKKPKKKKKKKKKKTTKESDNSRKWKLIEEEVNELKRKKSLLGGTIRELHDDADRFVFEVENSKDLESMKSLLTKSKSFHTTAKK